MPGRLTRSSVVLICRAGSYTMEIEMPKLKSKSGAKKRFRTTGTGKVRRNYACKRHGLRKRPKDMKRQTRGTTLLSAPDIRIVRKFLPYL